MRTAPLLKITITVPGPLLYSTNSFLKLVIGERFRGDIHYVWCSEFFDGSKLASYTSGSLTAPSSDPCAIYRQLKDDVARCDRHSAKIEATKTSLQALAVRWEADGSITSDQAKEIAYMVNNASFNDWRPLIYVIPRHMVEGRIQLVAPERRASLGVEYIVPDLRRSEFDIIEW